MTRLGDLLHFGQLFNARGNNYFAQIANTFYAIFVNLSNSFILLAKSFLGNFWRLFTGHTVWLQDSNLHSLDEESPVKSHLHQGYCYFFKYHVRVTGFGKKKFHFGNNFKNIWPFLGGLFCILTNFTILNAIGHIFIVMNG